MSLTLDARSPEGPIEEKWHTWLDAHRLVGPRNRGDYKVIVVGTGLAGASAAATLGRHGLQGRVLLLPGLGPPGPLDRRPGRHQRDQGLRQRRRLDPPPLRRHDQGRRLPLPRGERLAAGRALDPDHRPGRRPGRPLQPRVRRPARHPQLRRRARPAHLLLPRPDRPAAPARRLQSLQNQVADGQAEIYNRHEMLDIVVVDGDARGIIARNLVTGEIERPRRRRGRPRHRRLLQRLLPVDERDGLQRDRDLARPQTRRRYREPLLHADPPDLHPAVRRLPVEADPDERVAPKRRPDLGPAERRRGPQARPTSPTTSATTSSRSATRAFGNLVPRDVASRAAKIVCDDGLGVGGTGRGVYLDFRDAIEDKGATTSQAATGTSSRCTSGSRATTRRRRR